MLTIGRVAQQVGARSSTIRYYEGTKNSEAGGARSKRDTGSIRTIRKNYCGLYGERRLWHQS